MTKRSQPPHLKWLQQSIQTLPESLKAAISGRPLREVARITKVSAPTLSRVLRGHPADMMTFLKLIRWMTP